MSIIIATGGLDEMAIDVSYVIFSSIFMVVADLTAFSWWKHSLAAVVVACVFVLLDGALIQPWMFIVSRSSDGPYNELWQFKMRVISAVWFLLVIFTTASLVRVIRHREVKTDAHNAA
jgi:hypothetical protein